MYYEKVNCSNNGCAGSWLNMKDPSKGRSEYYERKYANHPGLDSGDCPLRIVVRPHSTGMSSRGFACSASGGHCVPSEHCKARQEEENHITFGG